MSWSRRASWIVVTLAVVVGVAATVFLSRRETPPDTSRSSWRAESATLVQRVEQLSSGGEVDAAASVLDVLLQRPDLVASGQGDRARMALARAYLAAGRRDQALTQVQAIPWADKGPQIAAEIVGLELAVRWRGLFDDQKILVSGAVTPRNSQEATFGRREGLWLDRWEQYRALATSLDRGARMVAAEGGVVNLPASAQMMRVARYSRGEANLAALMRDLGDPQTWSADLMLTLVRLHLSDHDLDAALAAGEVLWSRHAEASEAGLAYRELRLWQLRRRALGKRLWLWAYPAIDQRLDQLSTVYPAMASSAENAVRQEREVNQVAMTTGVQDAVLHLKADIERSAITESTVALEVEDIIIEETDREWHLALSYDGLAFTAEHHEVAAGKSVRFWIDSEHRGEHQVHIYRLAGRAAWDALCAKPSRALLPDSALVAVTVDLAGWENLGATQRRAVDIPDLGEGFYAATVTARGCPVVVLTGVTVADPDLHVIAGRSDLLGWVVRRTSGQGKAGEPVSATVMLVRNVERAAGKEWASADPAWRSGFTEGFTGVPSADFRRADQQTLFTQGLASGTAAALIDPAFSAELTGISDAGGLVRLVLPERVRGRSYQASMRIARPELAVQRTTTFGEDAAWTSRAVVWADKPLARPGETLRFKALLRDFNGDGYRLPVGELRTRVRLSDAVLSDMPLALSASGTISGEVVIPPGAVDGPLTVVLGEGSPQHLARVEGVRLPSLRYDVVGLDAGLQVRAGESVPLTVRLRDRGGEPLAGIEVSCELSAVADGIKIPCQTVPVITSDLAGEAHFSIPTAAGTEANYQAAISFRYENQRYQAGHEWQTRTFPFHLETVLRQRDLRVGGVAQIEVRLPVGAEVSLQFTQDGVRRGDPLVAKGRAPAWTQVSMGLTDAHVGANALTISTAVLGGGTTSRTVALSVQAAQALDQQPQVALIPVRNRVETGETLPLALGISEPGRDLLVLGGARDLLLARVERLDQNAKQSEVVVASDWAPNLFLSAVGYLPGQGFVSSERRAVEVLPVDRLLTVTVTPARTDLRPGEMVDAVVQVVDWRGQPATDCSLSLGVVNELLYQLAEDPTPDLWRYFHTYQRAWGLVEGHVDHLQLPRAMFWRSAIFRWQGGEPFTAIGSSRGGRGMRSSRHAGGMNVNLRARPLLQPESDGTIWWVADLRTDALGKATVRFPLPEHAGRFRCTARANDASAAVLVGEVRSVIASREPYACTLDLPEVVVGGDVVPAQIHLANHEDVAQTLMLTLPDGATRELELAPRTRRTLSVPVTIPRAGTSVGEIVRFAEVLGERLPLKISVATKEPGARTVSATASTLRRLPGVPIFSREWLVADKAGEVHLPMTIHPGAGLWMRVRAWPDAAERRASVLSDWRQLEVTPPLRVMGWLLAKPGAERRAALAKWWPTLDNTPAAIVVKQAALRRGEATVGITGLPDDLIGDWLLARGRALGQSLPAPRYRGLAGESVREKLAAAATALAEGWSEGPALWHAARRELQADLVTESVAPVALAIACDAARLAGDEPTSRLLLARLGQCRWDDQLVAVLAADLLPERGEAPLNQLRINVGADDSVLPAKDFTEWIGAVTGAVNLHTVPGAVVQLELILQQPLPLPQTPTPTLSLWQKTGDGYEAVAAGQPLWPGRRLLLVVDPAVDGGSNLTIAVPSLLRLERTAGEVFRIERWEESWPLDEFSRDDQVLELQRGHRAAVLATITDGIRTTMATRSPIGRRLSLVKAEDDVDLRGGNLVSVRSHSGVSLVFEVSTIGEGTCTWIGSQVDDYQLPERTITVAAGTVADPATPAVGHPLAEALIATAQGCTDEELAWLIGDHGWLSLADWQRALRILDPAAEQDLAELLDHPTDNRPGHWTQAKIRRWVDGEPLLHADAGQIRSLIGDDPPNLASLIALAEISREHRRQAWYELTQPQPAATAALVTLKRWYERLQQLGLIEATDYRTWCWQQSLDPQDIERLGYANTLDGWVSFIRQQLDLPLRIGSGVRTGSAVSVWVTLPRQDLTGQMMQREALASPGFGGAGLGTSGLDDGLVVVALADGYELRPFQPPPQPQAAGISVDYTDVPMVDVFDHLNLLLTNRGLSPVRLGKSITREQLAELPPITLRVADMPTSQVVDFITKLVGLKLTRDRQGMVFELEQ